MGLRTRGPLFFRRSPKNPVKIMEFRTEDRFLKIAPSEKTLLAKKLRSGYVPAVIPIRLNWLGLTSHRRMHIDERSLTCVSNAGNC